jgi:hypothetical protein
MLFSALQNTLDPSLCHPLGNVKQWLYLGSDVGWRLRTERTVLEAVPRIQVQKKLLETAARLRRPYIEWIGSLSRLNSSLEWWATNLAGKNPFHFFYFKVCTIAIARELMAEGLPSQTLLVSDSPAVLEEINAFASELGLSCETLPAMSETTDRKAYLQSGKSLLKRLFKIVRRPARKGQIQPCTREFTGPGTILFFTWIDRRSFDQNGRYVDPHFGKLPEMLKERGFKVAYVPRILTSIPLPEAIERLGKTGELFFYPNEFVSEDEILHCNRNGRKYRPLIPDESRIGEVPVKRLADEHIDEGEKKLAKALTYRTLIRNMKDRGIYPNQIIHLCEGHNWEQVMTWAVRRDMPKTKVIAFENAVFTRMLLSMYPAECEMNLRPLPDRIVTNGPSYRDVLIEEGFPPEMIRIGGCIRHNYIWERIGSQILPEITTPVCILVATPIGFSESIELVEAAIDAFGADARYKVVVKCHPMLDAKTLERTVGKKTNSNNVHYVDADIKELIRSSHILLYTYTSVCYEALLHGVFPVNVATECSLNLDQLEGAPDVRYRAADIQELKRVVERIVQMNETERKEWYLRARRAVRDALAPVTAETVDAFIA